MRRDWDRFEKAGARVVGVGQGEPRYAKAFCAARDIPFHCWSDPDHRAYRAFGLGRGGVLQILGPQLLWPGMKAAAKGHLLGRVVGDPFQLPGVFVLAKTGKVLLAHYSKDAADNPPNDRLLEALGV